MTLKDMRERLVQEIGVDVAYALDAGSNHPFSCKCVACKEWWNLCGPTEDNTYGPFSKEEIENDAKID